MRSDAAEWLAWADRHIVKRLFHFTDARNLPRIVSDGRLVARKLLPYFRETQPFHRSQPLSLHRDTEQKLDHYVFLSVCQGTPMNNGVIYRRRDLASVCIEVSRDVLTKEGTIVCTGIANHPAVGHARTVAELQDVAPTDRKFVEVLVLGVVDREHILNWGALVRRFGCVQDA